MMSLVEESKLPSKEEIIDVPLDNLAKVYGICQELEQVCERENGIGISAVQVGIPWRLFIVKGDGTCPLVPKGKFRYFVNCSYEPVTEERVVSLEGCLSLRSSDGRLRSFHVERYKEVFLNGHILTLDKDLNLILLKQKRLLFCEQGVVFQHEIEHSVPILISEIGKEIFLY